MSDAVADKQVRENDPVRSTLSTQASNDEVLSLQLADLVPAPWNARREFDPAALAGLADSLRENGQLQPIVVRRIKEDGTEKYQVIAGERRYRAAKLIGLTALTSTIVSVDEHSARKMSLAENLSRENLNEWEELHGILDLLSLELKRMPGWAALVSSKGSEKDAAAWVASSSGRSYPYPAPAVLSELEIEDPNELMDLLNSVFGQGKTLTLKTFRIRRLPLLTMPKDLQQAIANGRLSFTLASELKGIGDKETRINLMEEAIAGNWTANELSTAVKSSRDSAESVEVAYSDQVRQRMRALNRAAKQVDDLSAREKQRLDKLLADLEKLLIEPAAATA